MASQLQAELQALRQVKDELLAHMSAILRSNEDAKLGSELHAAQEKANLEMQEATQSAGTQLSRLDTELAQLLRAKCEAEGKVVHRLEELARMTDNAAGSADAFEKKALDAHGKCLALLKSKQLEVAEALISAHFSQAPRPDSHRTAADQAAS